MEKGTKIGSRAPQVNHAEIIAKKISYLIKHFLNGKSRGGSMKGRRSPRFREKKRTQIRWRA
jgi:hypothetical protein